MEDAELPQHRAAIVIDFFPSQAILGIERIDAAKRKLDSPPGRRKTAPFSQLRTANHDFKHNSIVGDMPALYFDFQVRQRPHQLPVKQPHAVATLIMFTPRLIVVPRSIAEGAENAFQVMLVFQSNVLLNNCNARQSRIFICVSRNRCACHNAPPFALSKFRNIARARILSSPEDA